MAVLLGASLPALGLVSTVDSYHLSDNLDIYTVDYWPVHVTSIAIISTASLKTTNLPITTATKAIASPISVAHSYLIDYYFRVHYSQININAGLTLSEQDYTIELWNSYFVSNTLNSITLTGLTVEDVSLSLPFTLPHVFTPLQSAFITLQVLPNTNPTVEGDITFNWATESSGIHLTATHTSLWSFDALSTFTESREWFTNVIPSRSQEQRFQLREYPRMTLDYSYTFRDNQEYTSAKNIAKARAGQPITIPLFSEITEVNSIFSGASEILLNTTYMEIEVGDLIVVWVSYIIWEIREVLEVQPTKIVLKQALDSAYAKACLMVVKSGYLMEGFKFQEGEGYSRKCKLSFEVLNPFVLASWPNLVSYLGLPVITVKNISTGNLGLNFLREQTKIDSVTGIYDVIDSEVYNRLTYEISLAAHTKAERYVLKRQLDYLKGRFNGFWVSSSQNDFIKQTEVSAGINTLKVKRTFAAENPFKYIYVKGSSDQIFEVLAIGNNLDGTETLTLFPVPGVNITISSIELLYKVRPDTDNFTINHERGIMTSKFIVKELP